MRHLRLIFIDDEIIFDVCSNSTGGQVIPAQVVYVFDVVVKLFVSEYVLLIM